MEEVKVTNNINFDLDEMTVQKLSALKIFKLKLLKAINKNIRKRDFDIKNVSDYFTSGCFIESKSHEVLDIINYYMDEDVKVKFDYYYDTVNNKIKYNIIIKNHGYKINIHDYLYNIYF